MNNSPSLASPVGPPAPPSPLTRMVSPAPSTNVLFGELWAILTKGDPKEGEGEARMRDILQTTVPVNTVDSLLEKLIDEVQGSIEETVKHQFLRNTTQSAFGSSRRVLFSPKAYARRVPLQSHF